MANAAPQLQEAYDLIETGDLQSARQLLEDIRPENENNPDYWWIYTHAVENEEDGMMALERVRQLAPNYPGLTSLSEQLGIQPAPPPPVDSPSTEDVEDFYEQTAETTHLPESSSNSLAFYVVAAIAVVLIVGALFFGANLLTGGGGTPTEVANVTDVPIEPVIPTVDSSSEDLTETPTDEPTEEVPTQTVVVPPTDTPVPPTEVTNDDPFAEIYSDLSEFGVPQEGISVDTTESFGETYIVTTCSALGPIATQNIIGIIDTLSATADALDETVTGFSFEITDCDTETVRLALGLPRDTVDSYWSGDISQPEIQQSLQRVN